MKISLAWVFDYFQESFQDADVKKIVDLFNRKTAEIEHYDVCEDKFDSFFIASAEKEEGDFVSLFCNELGEKHSLTRRSDLQVGQLYFIKKDSEKVSWATFAEFNSDKDGLMPAIKLDPALVAGGWRDELETHDYILDIDNKSINHRPDLWGHYGLAREIAATMGYTLKPLSEVCSKLSVVHSNTKSKKTDTASFSIEIQDLDNCFRFAGLKCENVQHQASNLRMALRLIRVGIKAINAVVDITNYVMLDVGHPMHVFDAAAFEKKEVVIRSAKNKEKLELLDGTKVELRTSDLVIADDTKPVSLAGIYGGLASGYTDTTDTLFLEAAGFDPTAIRKTAQHFKLRTEASTRFEKHLDPMQNITVLQRFLFLAQELGVLGDVSESIISVGEVIEPRTIQLSHSLIEKRMGIKVKPAFVVKSLESLGFGVEQAKEDYTVSVPTCRMTKDISIVEDVIEEVARLYGFDAIPHELPVREMAPFDMHVIQNIRKIKQFCASALRMHEVRDYLFYDESFLRELAPWTYNEDEVVAVQNPVSENWKVMVSSLIPHLLKHVINHQREHDRVRFFEWNNVWKKESGEPIESTNLSGVFYDAQNIEFYDAQEQLMSLFNMLNCKVVWRKKSGMPAWYDAHRSGALFIGDQEIGSAGMLDRSFCKSLSEQDLFIFELDATFLSDYQREVVQYQAWSKYQDVKQDISLFVPLSLTVHDVLETINNASSLIQNPVLVDFYEQEKWLDKRSITIRYTISTTKKTLDKSEIDAVVGLVTKAVEAQNGVVR